MTEGLACTLYSLLSLKSDVCKYYGYQTKRRQVDEFITILIYAGTFVMTYYLSFFDCFSQFKQINK